MQSINILELWYHLKSNTNTKQGGQLRVRDFNNWVNQISLDLFKEKFDKWEINQMTVDELSRPFLTSKVLTTKATKSNYSLLEYPKDYAYFSSVRVYVSPEKKVVKCPENKNKSVLADLCETNATKVPNAAWGSVCGNVLIPPTIDRVFVTQYEGGLKVAPKEVGYVTLDYLRYPNKSNLAFIVGSSNQTFDVANSTNVEWSETVLNEFLARLEVNYSKFIRDQFSFQTSNLKKETTL